MTFIHSMAVPPTNISVVPASNTPSVLMPSLSASPDYLFETPCERPQGLTTLVGSSNPCPLDFLLCHQLFSRSPFLLTRGRYGLLPVKLSREDIGSKSDSPTANRVLLRHGRYNTRAFAQ